MAELSQEMGPVDNSADDLFKERAAASQLERIAGGAKKLRIEVEALLAESTTTARALSKFVRAVSDNDPDFERYRKVLDPDVPPDLGVLDLAMNHENYWDGGHFVTTEVFGLPDWEPLLVQWLGLVDIMYLPEMVNEISADEAVHMLEITTSLTLLLRIYVFQMQETFEAAVGNIVWAPSVQRQTHACNTRRSKERATTTTKGEATTTTTTQATTTTTTTTTPATTTTQATTRSTPSGLLLVPPVNMTPFINMTTPPGVVSLDAIKKGIEAGKWLWKNKEKLGKFFTCYIGAGYGLKDMPAGFVHCFGFDWSAQFGAEFAQKRWSPKKC